MSNQIPYNYDPEKGIVSIPLSEVTLFFSLEAASDFFLRGLAFCMGVQKALLESYNQKDLETFDNPLSVVEDVVQFLKRTGGASGENS